MDLVQIATEAGAALIMVIVVAVVCTSAVLFVWFRKKAAIYNNHRVIVWRRHKDKEGSEVPIIVDLAEKGLIKYDKKLKKWSFHLKNANIHLGEEESKTYDENRDLDIPSIPYEKGRKVCFVEKIGNRKYAFGEPFILEGKVRIIVSEADVAEGIRSFDMNAKTFGKKKNELLAFTLYVIFATLILVMIIVILQRFESIASAAESFAEGAKAAAAAKGATIASGVPG